MKTQCLSCKATYDIPDEKVAAAGTAGLRVRCTSCRAVMVVDRDRSFDSSEDDTANALPRPRRRPDAGLVAGFQASEPEFTDIHGLAPAGPLPVTKGKDGKLKQRAGVRREVTGMHLASTAADVDKVWYAAIAGEARGPYAKDEMVGLARRGKVRGSTLVWRPGFDDWQRIRTRKSDTPGDLVWLRDVVVARKRQERHAQAAAKRKLGIHPIILDDDGNPGTIDDMLAHDADDLIVGDAVATTWWAQNGKVIVAGALFGVLLLLVAIQVTQSMGL